MSRTNDERRIGFIRPPWASGHSLVPHAVDTVQDAVRGSVFHDYEVLRDEGKRISDQNGRTLRQFSITEWAEAAGKSEDAIRLSGFQLRESMLIRLVLDVHGGEVGKGQKHRPRGIRKGGYRRASVYELVPWKDWLHDERAFPLFRGKHVVLGCGDRVGAWAPGPDGTQRWLSVFTAAELAEWHVGDVAGGLKAAAEAGETKRATETGEESRVSSPQSKPDPELPPGRPGVFVPPPAWAMVNAVYPGASKEMAVRILDFISLEAGQELTLDQQLDYLHAAGDRMKQHRIKSNRQLYLLKTLRSVIEEGVAAEPDDAIGRALEQERLRMEAKKARAG